MESVLSPGARPGSLATPNSEADENVPFKELAGAAEDADMDKRLVE